jgi:hypothetical protein
MLELIYTRCKQGIDILKKGQQILVDGYKVYSCTPAIMDDGAFDLALLENAAKTKQSYTDPGFMEDAFLYYTPDVGNNFLIDFYPVPFDANAEGDYSRRPGNFVNHLFAGDFSRFYPYELFHDKTVWTAKEKGEAYYYENIPAPEGLASREINNPNGQYDFKNDIGKFIQDGRQDALKKAVAFLIDQYNVEPEKRKYLVIKDENSRNVELWIAAIECAFSPKIAASISFATRMDKFANVNRYTVKNNLFQMQINLQDPNQKQRFRAMIVGVDERDKTNTAAARPLANSPFVLLDGKLKQAAFAADISNPYFDFITHFDDAHRVFCRQFLQSSHIVNPNIDMYDLYSIYSSLIQSSLPNTKTLMSILEKMSRYQLTVSVILKQLYVKVRDTVSEIMQEDLSSALRIISWLQETSKIVGADADAEKLSNMVCKKFADSLFQNGDSANKRNNWIIIKGTDFALNAARNVMVLNKDKISPLQKSSLDITAFITIYYDASLLLGNVNIDNLKALSMSGMYSCLRDKDLNSFSEISKILSKENKMNEQDCLLKIAKNENNELSEFIMNYLLNSDNSMMSNNNSLHDYCKKLKDSGLDQFVAAVLKKKSANVNSSADVEMILKIMRQFQVKNDQAANILSSIEKNILIDYFLKTKFTDEEQMFYLKLLLNASEDYFTFYVGELLESAEKNKEKWNSLFHFASDKESSKSHDAIFDCIVNALNQSKQKEKNLVALGKIIKDDNARKIYEQAMEKVKGQDEKEQNDDVQKKRFSLFGGKEK